MFKSICFRMTAYLFADTQLYKRLCPSVHLSILPSVVIELKSGKTGVLDSLCECLSVRLEIRLWLGVGRPCPPVRNNIVTPRHLFHNFVLKKNGNTLILFSFNLTHSFQNAPIWKRFELLSRSCKILVLN